MTMQKLDLGTDHIVGVVDGHIATLTFNRPEKRNAFGPELLNGLSKGLQLTAENDAVRVVVLTGEGSVFCAGGDLAGMGDNATDLAMSDKVEGLRAMQDATTLAIHQHPKPIIASLPGLAAGAGMGLALACDLRIGAAGAGFVPAFGAIAASGDFGGSWLLSRLIGPARAKEVYFTGRRIETAEAADLGLLNRVVPVEDLAQATQEMAAVIANQAPIALRAMKDNHNRAMVSDLQTTMAGEAAHMMHCFTTEDHKDAVKAFYEKRTPVFHGR